MLYQQGHAWQEERPDTVPPKSKHRMTQNQHCTPTLVPAELKSQSNTYHYHCFLKSSDILNTFVTHRLAFLCHTKKSILADKRFHSDNGKWEIPTKPWSYRSLGSVVKEIHPDPAWATKICEADVHQHWQGWLQHHNFSPSPQCCWELQSPFPGLPCSHSTEPCGRRHILIEYLWFVTFYCGSQFWFQ